MIGCMSGNEEAHQPGSEDPQGEQFMRLANTAEAMARTAERSARIHDEVGEHLPGAADHAARDRRLAAAEREAAEAFRGHRLPSQAVRDAIRESGTGADAANVDDDA
jgi:hypothetical protein